MVEERGSRKAGCAGRVTGHSCPQRKQTQKLFWERSRQYKILVERHPKSCRTKTHKENIDFSLDHLTRSVTFMWAGHNNQRWDVPSVRGSIWWWAQDKSSLRRTILQSQTTAGQTICQYIRYSHALMMLAESPPRKMRRIPSYLNNFQKMYKSHPHH